jgi:hypothetical protein
MRTLVIQMLCAVIWLTAPAGATTITVDWAGSGDFTDIQAGIDSASTGDTVVVLVGTYTDAGNRDLDFGGTNLVLMSDAGSATTIIDCGDAGRGLHFHNGEDTTAVVRGFTITNAVADSGAGAFCESGSDPRFEDCIFLENTAQNHGGGLCCLTSSPIVRGCTFEGNVANQDGSPGGYGGGMACLSSASVLIVDTDFVSNQAYYLGGGLYAYYSPLTCEGCVFSGNNIIQYGSSGGGAALGFSDGATFTGCTFTENGNASTVVGAGLHADASDMTVTDCRFVDNTAGSASGANLANESDGTITGCTFAGNTTTWGGTAGGIRCASSSNPTISNCTFTDNRGHHILCQGASPTVEYSILAFTDLGDPVACMVGTETPHVHHCVVYGNAGTDTLCGGNFHDIANVLPLFCDRLNGDYTLCADSPCLAGHTWPELVGAEGQGCPACGNATEPRTWGAVKALYR